MPRGRKTTLTIHLTLGDQQTLLAWQRSTTISAGRARRGRIILLLAKGCSISAVALTVGVARRHVYKWAQRFLTTGLEGLANQHRHGARRRWQRSALPVSQDGGADGGLHSQEQMDPDALPFAARHTAGE